MSALVQTGIINSSAGGTYTISFPSAVTAGNFLVAGFQEDASGVTVKDSLNANWTKVSEVGNLTNWFTNLWFHANTAGGTDTVTLTNASASFYEGFIAEYSGVPSTSTATNASGTAINGSAATTIAVSTTTGSGNASDLVVVASGDSTVGTGIAPNSVTNSYVVEAHATTLESFALVANLGNAASGTESTTITWTSAGAGLYPSVIASWTAGAVVSAHGAPLRVVRQAVNRAATY